MDQAVADASYFDIAPLGDNRRFGAMVSGLAVQALERDEARKALYDLWIDKGVILFRGLDGQEEQIALSRVFGQLEKHLFPEVWVDGRPELVNIKYWRGNGSIVEVDGVPTGGWLHWHFDLAYSERINRGGILRPIQLPGRGGQTGFIDQIAAYESLPQRLKDRIEGLHGVYLMDLNPERIRFGRPKSLRLVEEAPSYHKIMEREWEYPRILHPLVYRQKETGRKVLRISPWFLGGVYELGGTEGAALLEEVIGYCIDPANIYIHDWREGDMVLWDNWRTLHSALGVPPDDTRIMHRTTIYGDYALGRVLDSSRSREAAFDV
jgi:taurine dioxygenase